MGSIPSQKKSIKIEELSEIEKLLYESYRKIDVDFTFNEVTTLKLKLTDDKFYFYTTFSFMLFFNNSIFTENVNQIYKNFNSQIESFINNPTNNKYYNVLLIIDDEIETLKSGTKIDFDGLFTVAFERLEIYILIYIDVTNCHPEYINEFLKQLCENTILYKSGRKFDCIYLLLPTTDYIVKNSQTVTYITTRNDYHLTEYETNCLYELFNFDTFQNFLRSKYPPTSSNNQFAKFIKKVKPFSTSSAIFIDFNYEISEFPNENLYQLIAIETLTYECPDNIIYIYINSDFNYNPNFDLFMNKVFSSFEQAIEKFTDKKVYLKIKILLVNSNDSKRSKGYFGLNLLGFSNTTNNNNITNKKENHQDFKLKELENKVNELICKKFKKRNKNTPINSNLIIEFHEILDDEKNSETKLKKYRKTTMDYKFVEQKNIITNEYRNLIIALAKKNYLNQLFKKENIETNKIHLKLSQFLNKKIILNPEDKNINNKKKSHRLENNIKREYYENGLEVVIESEENAELVNTFENTFFMSL
jgi:hypothetical protein